MPPLDTIRMKHYKSLVGSQMLLDLGKTTERRFKLRRFVGAGAFSACFEAINLSIAEPKYICVARMTQVAEPGVEYKKGVDPEAETELWKTLQHPNIVTFMDHQYSEKYYIQLAEYLRGGTMQERLKKYRLLKMSIQTSYIVQWIVDITRALDYLHDKNIAHFDIKPANIAFVNRLYRSPAKLIDFGLALDVSKRYKYGFRGTEKYASPEMREYMLPRSKRKLTVSPGTPSDVWSLGQVFYLALFGVAPILTHAAEDASMEKTMTTTIQWPVLNSEVRVDVQQTRIENFGSVLTGMLQVNPASRWTIKQVLEYLSPYV